MTRMRRAAFLAVAAVVSVLPAAPAFGHAMFARPREAPANTDAALVMEVPNERDETNYNVKVVVALPGDVIARSCQAEAPWQCRLIAAAGGEPAQVEWTREREAPADEWDEAFRFSAFTGAAGIKYFPTIQTYHHASSSGHGGAGVEVAWIGTTADSELPAARLTVTGAAGTTTTTGPGGSSTTTTTGGTSASTTTTARAAASATTSTTASASGTSTTTRPTTTASTTAAGSAGPGTTSTTARRPTSALPSSRVSVSAGATDPGPLASTGPPAWAQPAFLAGVCLALAGAAVRRCHAPG